MSDRNQAARRHPKRLRPGAFRKIAQRQPASDPPPARAGNLGNTKLNPVAMNQGHAPPTLEWSAIRMIDERDRRLSFSFRFPASNGIENTLELSTELTPAEMVKKLRGYTTRLPRNPKDAAHFVEDLINAAPEQPITKVSQPGWKMAPPADQDSSQFQPQAFAVPGQIIPSNCDQLRWATTETGPRLGQTSGNLQEWNSSVSPYALLSSDIAFSVMTALASTLLPFSQLSEGAVFNKVGETSTGKTTDLKTAMSVQGHPMAFNHWDTSPRTLEEQAAAHNHVLFGKNAAERNVGKDRREILKRMFHGVPDGQSMSRSREVQDRFRDLSWSNLTMTTSNKTGAQMAAELGLEWAEQEQVRFIDIRVPDSAQGGIFDRLDSSNSAAQAQSGQLIHQLDAALGQNYGVLLGPWIEHLLKVNPTRRIRKLTERFLKEVKAKPGMEERIARKFALVYAAGRIAVDAGLLRWPKGYPLEVTLCLYWRAHDLRTKGSKDLQSDLLRFRQMMDDQAYVPKAKAGKIIKTQAGQSLLGVRTVHKKLPVVAIRQEGLAELFGSSSKAVLEWLRTSGAVMEGHGSRSSQQLPVQLVLGGTPIDKPRFLVCNMERLEKALPGIIPVAG